MQAEEITEMLTKQETIIENLTSIMKDHESRLRFIERVVGYGLGAVGLVEFAINALNKHT